MRRITARKSHLTQTRMEHPGIGPLSVSPTSVGRGATQSGNHQHTCTHRQFYTHYQVVLRPAMRNFKAGFHEHYI